MSHMHLPIMPPVKPMLAKATQDIPHGGFSYEPKWDGFRALVFYDGHDIEIGSRRERPLTRYFPELVDAVARNFTHPCVIDGEIIVVNESGTRLDFESLQQRIHPAQSRIDTLSDSTPARFVAFDLLALDDVNLMKEPLQRRRATLRTILADARSPIHMSQATDDHKTAQRWFAQFEGAGLDGVVAKPLNGTYQPNKRGWYKVKHERTAECVIGGYRTHKTGDDRVGSLLLGLYDDAGDLFSVGVCSAFRDAERKKLFTQLQPLVTHDPDHPWTRQRHDDGYRTPLHAQESRWSAGKDLSFTPLEPRLVAEVKYDHLEGERFRHSPRFLRWRPDRDPRSCTYTQLQEVVSYDIGDVLA